MASERRTREPIKPDARLAAWSRVKQGTKIHDVFQGAQIGKWRVLAPSRDRYIRLIPDLDKTPQSGGAIDGSSS
jgi:hypothetical protein